MSISTSTAPARSAGISFGAITPDRTRRGRIKAAAFGALVYFGLSFALALVLSDSTLPVAQLAALILGSVMAGRLVGARDGRDWLATSGSVVVSVVAVSLVLWAFVALLVWGPFAP